MTKLRLAIILSVLLAIIGLTLGQYKRPMGTPDTPVDPMANAASSRKVVTAEGIEVIVLSVTRSTRFADDRKEIGVVDGDFLLVRYSYKNENKKSISVMNKPSIHLRSPESELLYRDTHISDAELFEDIRPGVAHVTFAVFDLKGSNFDPQTWRIVINGENRNLSLPVGSISAQASN